MVYVVANGVLYVYTRVQREKPENHQLPVIHYKNEPRLLAKSSLSTPEALSFPKPQKRIGEKSFELSLRNHNRRTSSLASAPLRRKLVSKRSVSLPFSLFPRSVAPPQKQESPGINYLLPFQWLREGRTPVGEITALRNINEISIKEAPV